MLRDDRDGYMGWRGRERKPREYRSKGYIPTIRDIDEFNADTHMGIIRQVVSGDAAYYGLGAEQYPTPEHNERINHDYPKRSRVPAPAVDTRTAARVDPQEIGRAFRRAWSVLHPEVHPLDVATHQLERDEELKAAFAKAYAQLQAAKGSIDRDNPEK